MELLQLDLRERADDGTPRNATLHELDDQLSRLGLVELRGHSVTEELRDNLRAAAHEFFGLPANIKEKYRLEGYGNGWRDYVHSDSLTGGEGTVDLHEELIFGATDHHGVPAIGDEFYPENKWPAEVPAIRATVEAYANEMMRVSNAVFDIMADILGVDHDRLRSHVTRPSWTLAMNRYPSLRETGVTQPGQFRVGAHRDLGTITLLHRQEGVGGLEIFDGGGWSTPPYHGDSLLLMLGELMTHWTAGRWTAPLHRVGPPSALAPDEELMSLVFFCEANPDASLTPIHGGVEDGEAVVAGEWIRHRIQQITDRGA